MLRILLHYLGYNHLPPFILDIVSGLYDHCSTTNSNWAEEIASSAETRQSACQDHQK